MEKQFRTPVTLERMKEIPELEEMVLLRRGNRLSVMPVTPAEWNRVVREGAR